VAAVIEQLALPRYGLAGYLRPGAAEGASADERRVLANLNRAGRRLIGFCRTNLFKRLESSGNSFLLSLHRHILRNMIYLHALDNGLPIPIGTQDAGLLDTAVSDREAEWARRPWLSAADDADITAAEFPAAGSAVRQRATEAYELYRTQYPGRFDWLGSDFFTADLVSDLKADAEALLAIARSAGAWDPQRDAKLTVLQRLLTRAHGKDKLLVFSQFADTARYVGEQLAGRGVTDLAVVTSDHGDPTALARRFSPRSNRLGPEGRWPLAHGESELRVLIATDVLAEGQNLQDCWIVVNYDLPWAIIRLLQRAGRVDRIGQEHDAIRVYSFMPADGVERVIRLRDRLFHRLQANQEVIGTDEAFFGERPAQMLRDLYTERAGSLDDDQDQDVDLTSQAQSIWQHAPDEARRRAAALPPVVYATRSHQAAPEAPAGILAYLRFPDGADSLVRVDNSGRVVSQSMTAVLRAAACQPDTPALPRREDHHELTRAALEHAVAEVTGLGGQVGSLRGTRRKVYEQLRSYRAGLMDENHAAALDRLLDVVFRYPLLERANESLGRQLRLGITPSSLAQVALEMYQNDELVRTVEQREQPQPTIMCTMGLKPPGAD
jgi:hypothetical protein